jgi:cellulose synthase/poly-beta-1,6-N-acetylglucosamine synthase-like glycosyltransferase
VTVAHDSATSAPSRPVLSVVIIGRNEGDRLERCILSAQAIEGWTPAEILYVDSGSTDGSLDLASGLGAKVLPLSPGAFTAARARNLGWRHAGGELVLFLDGDTILNPDFPLAALAELQCDPTNAAAWGHRREVCPCLSIYVRVLDLDWVYPPGETPFFGGDVLVRRVALEAVNGFDETLIAGEEPEMCRRMRTIGWHIQHIDVPMTLHDLAIIRFSQYWRRSQRAGYAFASVSARFRATSDPFWSSEARHNRLRGIFWLLSPVLALAVSAILMSLLPFAIWLLLVVALAARTAWQCRWKRASWTTLLLYGFHSHLQQVPIFFGQVQFLLNRNKALIEYKDVSAIPEKPTSENLGIHQP